MSRAPSSHLLVALQFAGVALSCYPVGWQNHGHPFWLAFCAIGTALGITTLCYNKLGNFSVYPEPKTGTELITHGPYQYARHPMYTSLIVMMFGIACYNGHWLNVPGLALVLIAVLLKADREEVLLAQVFAQYPEYCDKTRRFIPGIY